MTELVVFALTIGSRFSLSSVTLDRTRLLRQKTGMRRSIFVQTMLTQGKFPIARWSLGALLPPPLPEGLDVLRLFFFPL